MTAGPQTARFDSSIGGRPAAADLRLRENRSGAALHNPIGSAVTYVTTQQ